MSYAQKRSFDFAGSSSKRVRFDEKSKSRKKATGDTDFEFDHEDQLEERKTRRGAVNFDVYGSDDEEVGGGMYSDSDQEEKEEEEPAPKQDEEFDMFGGDGDDKMEVDKKGKKKATTDELLEGQELNSHSRDRLEADDDEDDDEDDVEDGQKKQSRIEAFNMKEELEEGSVDSNGNYIRNKVDPQAFHDNWMKGITRKDINKAKEAQQKRDREEALKEAERQSNLPQSETDIYLALVHHLRPGQSVQEALTSLANSLPKKLPAWKQKMLDKKNKNKPVQQSQLTEQEETERREKVEKITGLADQMMALGHFNIYQDTYEMMIRHLRKEGAVDQDWLPPQ
ncbi:LIN1-like protein [Choanephora cucurbitarum]|uniref:LIN1-like protein n=2 Tax=Choanephora cucurbitarum TaxID=101091 RepID=A0A1C7N615_9FUNG|nr:LIN1-like protein [Choanephora cucurbitarum]